jgi:hypothetical protein
VAQAEDGQVTGVSRNATAPLAATALAIVGWLVAAVAGIGALGLRIADPAPVLPTTFGMDDPRMVVFAILAITWASVGAVLMVKQPGNRVGQYALLIGVAYALSILAGAVTFSAWAEGSDAARGVAEITAWLTVLTSAITGFVLYVPLVFPTGRGYTPGWNMVRRIFLVALFAFWVSVLTQPGSLQLFPGIDNPFGIGPDLRGQTNVPTAPLLIVVLIVAIPLYVGAIASRYRRAPTVERQQTKWFLFALGATAVSLLATTAIGMTGFASSAIPLALYGVSSTMIPVSIAIAILRYRLYEIDRIISRTLSYAVVTGILAVVFSAVVLLLQTLLTRFTGGQTIAVAASTLAAFALFQPVLRGVRHRVDRRFDRARYDAERTALAFSERLRNEVDLSTVTADLVHTAGSTVAPSRLAIWLRPGTTGR